MDKPTIVHEEIEHLDVEAHRVPNGIQPFHEAYGLWVFSFQRRRNWSPSEPGGARYFKFYGLSHLIHGDGWYWTPEGGVTMFEAGQGVLSTPGTIQHYGGYKAAYSEDSICFAGPIADNLRQAGVIRDGVLTIGSVRRLLPIMDLAKDPAVSSQLKANMALQNLLVELHFENQYVRRPKQCSKIVALLETIARNPQESWTVSEMAEICNLCETQFRRVFYAHVGMRPKQYVDQLKLRKASERLCSSDDTILRIAKEFGYSDPYHFSRRFKDFTGFSPRQYRLKYSMSK